jgi:hypothetical protein
MKWKKGDEMEFRLERGKVYMRKKDDYVRK